MTQQIYSLPHLATLESTHFPKCDCKVKHFFPFSKIFITF